MGFLSGLAIGSLSLVNTITTLELLDHLLAKKVAMSSKTSFLLITAFNLCDKNDSGVDDDEEEGCDIIKTLISKN